MSTRSRALFLGIGIGIALAIATSLAVLRKAQSAAKAGKPTALRTPVGDIAAGHHRFIPDLYGKAPNSQARSLLFLRKADGSLRAWYWPLIDRTPATPGADWLTPDQKCDEFTVDAQREEIRCVVRPAGTDQVLHLRWSWDGRSFGPFAPDLKPVPGQEENGAFVFDVASTILANPPK